MLLAAASFSLAGALIVLLPGPDTLVVLRSLLRAGPRAAVYTALGVMTGLSAWVLAATFGLSALLRASHDGYLALRLVGGCYLALLGIRALRSRGATGELDDTAAPGRGGVLGTGYLAGLTTDVLNPKVGVFMVTFLPAFIPAGASVAATSLLFGVIFIVETGLYFLVFLRFADRLLGLLRRQVFRRRLDQATGAILIGFGVRLALEP